VKLIGPMGSQTGYGAGRERNFTHVLPGRHRIVVSDGDGEHEQECGTIDLAPAAVETRQITVR
jgi:hypothetical protein